MCLGRMLQTPLTCGKCGGTALRKNGSRNGQPKYQCTACRHQALPVPAAGQSHSIRASRDVAAGKSLPTGHCTPDRCLAARHCQVGKKKRGPRRCCGPNRIGHGCSNSMRGGPLWAARSVKYGLASRGAVHAAHRGLGAGSGRGHRSAVAAGLAGAILYRHLVLYRRVGSLWSRITAGSASAQSERQRAPQHRRSH